MRRIALLGMIILLAACQPSEEEKARVKKELPPGCTLIDLGSYGSIDYLVMIKCEGQDTVSTHTIDRRSTGKTTVSYQSVVFSIGS